MKKPTLWMYHSIDDYTWDPHQVTVKPARFEQQLRWLKERGKRGVTAREALASPGDESLVGLTFDDGYADFAEQALPILKKYGFTASLYVVTGHMGEHNKWDEPGPKKPLVTPDQVKMIADAGMEIGSHSVTHPDLRKVSGDSLEEEVNSSKRVLEEIIGEEVTGLCYPYGFAEDREIAAVEAAGYDYACVVLPKGRSGRHAMSRVCVGDADGSLRLYAKPIEAWLRDKLPA